MTVRGGGVPAIPTALMPFVRMGPPPRSFRCDAHHCIMVWVFTHRIQGCSTNVRAPHAGSPRTSSSQPQQVCRRARTRQGRSPCGWRYAPSLTASARAGHLIPCGSGRGNGLSRSNKETDVDKYRYAPQGTPLTKPAQYKVSEENQTRKSGTSEVAATAESDPPRTLVAPFAAMHGPALLYLFRR